MKYKILSVGGSIIIPKTGFDIPFLKKFRALILRRVLAGERFILVIGGGGTCRAYQDAAKAVVPMTNTDLDWVGIYTTQFNAHFVRYLFKGYAHTELIGDPEKKIKTNKPILVGAGYAPGASTDHDAVLIAKTYGAKQLLNLSNIEYVYDKDPNKFSDAQKIESIDWKTFRKEIVGNVWTAGKNVPFDPVASREAERLGLTVSILNGTNLPEVQKALAGKKFKGTVITSHDARHI
ncbi:MAG: UMP kinase [Patescibacteria group bacterium]